MLRKEQSFKHGENQHIYKTLKNQWVVLIFSIIRCWI